MGLLKEAGRSFRDESMIPSILQGNKVSKTNKFAIGFLSLARTKASTLYIVQNN